MPKYGVLSISIQEHHSNPIIPGTEWRTKQALNRRESLSRTNKIGDRGTIAGSKTGVRIRRVKRRQTVAIHSQVWWGTYKRNRGTALVNCPFKYTHSNNYSDNSKLSSMGAGWCVSIFKNAFSQKLM